MTKLRYLMEVTAAKSILDVLGYTVLSPETFAGAWNKEQGYHLFIPNDEHLHEIMKAAGSSELPREVMALFGAMRRLSNDESFRLECEAYLLFEQQENGQ